METTQTHNNDAAIAREILNQLGGNKFIAMTGATVMRDGATLVAKFKGSRIANIMYITLNAMDLYDVRICKFRGCDIKEVATMENAYSDMLQPFFTQTTKLYTSL
ncbi:MAG: hypothetical protein ACK5XN_18150 [Bacteroidota bacterium]|jgi:hypothetical protein